MRRNFQFKYYCFHIPYLDTDPKFNNRSRFTALVYSMLLFRFDNVVFRYANNSNYKNDTMIRKEAYVHSAVMDELRRIIEDSEIMAEVRFNIFVCLYFLT
jgi:hypothetical protein